MLWSWWGKGADPRANGTQGASAPLTPTLLVSRRRTLVQIEFCFMFQNLKLSFNQQLNPVSDQPRIYHLKTFQCLVRRLVYCFLMLVCELRSRVQWRRTSPEQRSWRRSTRRRRRWKMRLSWRTWVHRAHRRWLGVFWPEGWGWRRELPSRRWSPRIPGWGGRVVVKRRRKQTNLPTGTSKVLPWDSQ